LVLEKGVYVENKLAYLKYFAGTYYENDNKF